MNRPSASPTCSWLLCLSACLSIYIFLFVPFTKPSAYLLALDCHILIINVRHPRRRASSALNICRMYLTCVPCVVGCFAMRVSCWSLVIWWSFYSTTNPATRCSLKHTRTHLCSYDLCTTRATYWARRATNKHKTTRIAKFSPFRHVCWRFGAFKLKQVCVTPIIVSRYTQFPSYVCHVVVRCGHEMSNKIFMCL